MSHAPVADFSRHLPFVFRRALALSTWSLLLGAVLSGQTQVRPPSYSIYDGTTPTMSTPGAPADAYSLSSIESLNLATGHLTINIPLTEIIGRGRARQKLILNVEAPWTATPYSVPTPPGCGAPNNPCTGYAYGTNVVYGPFGSSPTYAQGLMQSRVSGDVCMTVVAQQVKTYWTNTLTRLSFTSPDGTEHEFVDAKTGGLLQPTSNEGDGNGGKGFDRGPVFVATDGSGAVYTQYDGTEINGEFTRTQDIYDSPGASCVSGSGKDINALGYLTLRDGTRYKIKYGYVVEIRDRNGNTLEFPDPDNPTFLSNLGCLASNNCTFAAQDALGRITQIVSQPATSSSPMTETITYPGQDGSTRQIVVTFRPLGDQNASGVNLVLRNQGDKPQTINVLFGGQIALGTAGNSQDPSDPTVVSQVQYPNGQSYRFWYDTYGNVTELDLPTGGYYRYYYAYYFGSLTTGTGQQLYTINPYVTRKEVYVNGGLAQVIQYTPTYYSNGSVNGLAAQVAYTDGAGNNLGSENHTFFSPGLGINTLGTDYNGWEEGKELSANYYASDGKTILRSESTTWEQRPCSTPGDVTNCWFERPGGGGGDPNHAPASSVNDPAAPPHDARIALKTDTLPGVTSQDLYLYNDNVDSYNNVIEHDEYPYNNTSTPWRKTLTAYNANSSYTQNSVDLISLPISETVTDGSGNTLSQTTYTYDQNTPTAESGITFYDSAVSASRGNITTVTQQVLDSINGNTSLSTKYTYDVAGNMLSMQDQRGVWRQWGYQDSGIAAGSSYAFPTSITSYTGTTPSGALPAATLKWNYNIGKPMSATDINNNVTSYQYVDPLDRLTLVAKPDSGWTEICYNDTPGSPTVTSKVATQSSASPSSCGYGNGESPLASIITTVGYDGLGRKVITNVAGLIETIYAYDGRGRLSYTSLPAGGAPPTECLQSGGATTPTCIPSSGTFTQFDEISRPTAVIQAGGATTSSVYTANQTLITDPAGAARLNTTDRDGNLLAVVEDPNGLAYNTAYTYDPLNDLTGVSQTGTNGKQTPQTRNFTYDSLKRLVQAVNPESGTIKYSYDASGNLLTRTDASNIVTTSAYDGLNRITLKSYSNSSNSTPSVSYTYDTGTSKCGTGKPGPNFLGRLTSVGNGNSTSYGCYDQVGRVTSSTQSTGGITYPSFSYAYDLSGALTSETYPSQRTITNSLFDAAGRVTQVQGTLGTTTTPYAQSVTYVPQGINVLTLGNNLTETWSYTTKQKQPTALAAAKSGTNLLTLGWGYGADTANNGNILSATISATPAPGTALNASQAFSYDGVNRLITSSEGVTPSTAGVWSRNHGYDQFGNGWVSAWTGITPSSFTPQSSSWINAANNRLVNSAMNVGYDNGATPGPGNLTSIGVTGSVTTYAYDAEDRMVTADEGTTLSTGYVYDGDGRRVQKLSCPGGTSVCTAAVSGATVTNTYVYDASGSLVAEYAAQPAPIKCTTCYLTADHLGSTRMVTDSNAVVQSLTDYLPFGEEIQSTVGTRSASYYPPSDLAVADGVTQKFTGKERDVETGLDYFGARYLGSAMGRFTSPDPVAGSIFNPQSLNMYAYVWNNPLRLTDPTGMIVSWEDSECKKKGAEASCRTDLQRKYEDRIKQLQGSKDKKERAKGDALAASYDKLQEAKETFHVVREDGSGSGELTYKGHPGDLYVEMKGSGSMLGEMPDLQKVAHEFKHGEQFLDGLLGFQLNTKGKWVGYRDDLVDEGNAFMAGFMAEPVGSDQTKFLQGLQTVANQFGLRGVVDKLGQPSSPYFGRSPTQLDMTFPSGKIPPNIYGVPRTQ